MSDFNNEETPNYLKPDAPTFENAAPPEQPAPQQQPVYNYTPPVQQIPMQPVYQPPKRTDGLGIASMILGILSIICCWATFFGLLLGIVGLILGLCAPKTDGKKSGFSIAGIITSSVGVVLGFIWLIFVALAPEILSEYSYLDDWYRYEI